MKVEDGTVATDGFIGEKEKYCDRMEKPGVFADHIMVMMTARLLKKDIKLLTSSPTSGEYNNMTRISGLGKKAGSPLIVGHRWDNQYISLCPEGGVYMYI